MRRRGFAVENVPAYDLTQVRRYVRDEPLRGAILRHLLDQDFGDEIVLIGHSLGSVIAIDLLDHLPEHVHVRRFLTIGSPAAAPSLHEGSERLLKNFRTRESMIGATSSIRPISSPVVEV